MGPCGCPGSFEVIPAKFLDKVALVVDAPTAAFDVLDGPQMLKRVSIKQVVRGKMPLERFITLMLEQARSEERLRLAKISAMATR